APGPTAPTPGGITGGPAGGSGGAPKAARHWSWICACCAIMLPITCPTSCACCSACARCGSTVPQYLQLGARRSSIVRPAPQPLHFWTGSYIARSRRGEEPALDPLVGAVGEDHL